MLDRILQADKNLFLLLNGLNSPFFDRFMELMSDKIIWIPLYLLILFLLVRKYRRHSLVLILLFIPLLVFLSDQLSVHAFKNVFQRLRPCHNPELSGLVHLVNNHCGGKYGFVSSHASNVFSVAVFSLMLLRNRWFSLPILFWASLVSYSRVYLGVHYPGDILGGAILGCLIGYGLYALFMITVGKILGRLTFFSRPPS